MALFADIGKIFRGEIRENEPLDRHTSLRVGGPADIFVVPADRTDLITLMSVLIPGEVPYLVIGGGYNLLVRDGGFRGVVICLERLHRVEFMAADGCIFAEAGTGNQQLVRFSQKHLKSGLEFLCGIPGTVGGAIAVNAGAHGASILDRVESLTTVREGKTTVRGRSELQFGYRYTKLDRGEIVLSALFRLESATQQEIDSRIRACIGHRRSAQQVHLPNAGSFFRNPPGMEAWRLIDEAGMRGATVGGAGVSDVHANFLVNTGGATAADFLELAALIKEKVKERSGVQLEEEVRIVGHGD